MPNKKNENKHIFRLLLDVREAQLFDKCNEYLKDLNINIELVSVPLHLGDAIIEIDSKQIILFERKCMTDLISSIKDGRYEEQSHRLCGTIDIPRHQCIYLIEGTFSQLRNPKVERKIVNSAITSLLFFKGFSVIRTFSINETAEYLVMCIDKLQREYNKGEKTIYSPSPTISKKVDETDDVATGGAEGADNMEVKQEENNDGDNEKCTVDETLKNEVSYCTVVKKVKKENVTPENIGEIILCQIPGISSTNAVQIMRIFNGSLSRLIETAKTDPKVLSEIQIVNEKTGKKRKINRNIVENIVKYIGI